MTTSEAVRAALRDLAIAHKRSPEDALNQTDIYERVLRDFLPEAITMGTEKCIEEERFHPAPATLRKHVWDMHQKLMATRAAVVPRRGDGVHDGMVCLVCGARAIDTGKRYVMDHDAHAHGVYQRLALV